MTPPHPRLYSSSRYLHNTVIEVCYAFEIFFFIFRFQPLSSALTETKYILFPLVSVSFEKVENEETNEIKKLA